MSDGQSVAPEVLSQLADTRGSGDAADGRVFVQVDGTGDIVDLVIEPAAMGLGPQALADAVRQAFRNARDRVQESLRSSPPAAAAGPPDLAALAQVGMDAQRRLSELTTIAEELSNRLRRMG